MKSTMLMGIAGALLLGLAILLHQMKAAETGSGRSDPPSNYLASKDREDGTSTTKSETISHLIDDRSSAGRSSWPEPLRRLLILRSTRWRDFEELILALEDRVRSDGTALRACIQAVRDKSISDVARVLLLGIVGQYASPAIKLAFAESALSLGDKLHSYATLGAILLKGTSLQDENDRRDFWRMWYYTNASEFSSTNDTAVFQSLTEQLASGDAAKSMKSMIFEHNYLHGTFPIKVPILASIARTVFRTSPMITQRWFNSSPYDARTLEMAQAVLRDPEGHTISKGAALRYIAWVSDELASSESERSLLKEANPQVVTQAAMRVPPARASLLLSARYWSETTGTMKFKIVDLLVSNRDPSAWNHLKTVAQAEENPDIKSSLAHHLQVQALSQKDPDERIVDVLRILARDSDQSVRVNTVYALSRCLSIPGARELLSSMASGDSAEEVRSAARASLESD